MAGTRLLRTAIVALRYLKQQNNSTSSSDRKIVTHFEPSVLDTMYYTCKLCNDLTAVGTGSPALRDRETFHNLIVETVDTKAYFSTCCQRWRCRCTYKLRLIRLGTWH
jgi:hypothetical protein